MRAAPYRLTASQAGGFLGQDGRVLLALPLALLLCASPDGRGSTGTLPEEAVALRTAPRVRAGIGGALLFGLAEYAPSFGAGVSLDLGAVLFDRLSLFFHGEVGTIIFTLIGTGGPVVEYALSDHFTAGLGVALTAWTQLAYGLNSGSFLGLTFPLRVSFSPAGRKANETARGGLLLGLSVAPGFSLLPTYYPQLQNQLPPSPGLAAALTISTAWW